MDTSDLTVKLAELVASNKITDHDRTAFEQFIGGTTLTDMVQWPDGDLDAAMDACNTVPVVAKIHIKTMVKNSRQPQESKKRKLRDLYDKACEEEQKELFDSLFSAQQEKNLKKIQSLERQLEQKNYRNTKLRVPAGSSSAKKNIPPETKLWSFEEVKILDASEAWKSVSNFSITVKGETSMRNSFCNILRTFGHEFFEEKSKNRKNTETSTFPDIVYHKSDSFDPRSKSDRSKILIDIDLKQRFQSQKYFPPGKSSDYPTDLQHCYHQLLKRAEEAYVLGGLDIYYYVLIDLEKVIFTKICVVDENHYSVQQTEPLPFGASWKKTKKNNFLLEWNRVDETIIPKGFSYFYSLVHWRMSGEGWTSLFLNGKHFTLLRRLGIGKTSFVYEALSYENLPCAIKLEPLFNSEQIDNEINILPQLAGCKGVPNMLYNGTTDYKGKQWKVICTDIIGEYSTKDLKRGACTMEKIVNTAKMAIDILKGIHLKGFVHGDLKPEHLIFSCGMLYIIDYGGTVPINSYTKYTSHKFSSIESDSDMQLAPHSDFESLWFVMLNLCECLPWKSTDEKGRLLFQKLKMMPSKKKELYPLLSELFVKLIPCQC